MKFKTYQGQPLSGLLTLKIDGVRAHKTIDGWFSRSGKPLYNLPDMPMGIYEVYYGTWEDSISACRTKNADYTIPEERLYMLYPKIDHRLLLKIMHNEYVPDIPEGIEGYVVHSICGTMFKHKKINTYDVKVIDYQPGNGKHNGRMGALITEMGKVGTGFSDKQREEFTEDYIIGKVIEVECMELTSSGKFRMPRFIRLRLDKEV